MTPPPQPQPEWKPGRAAGNTVVVLAVLFVLFCVLAAIGCGVLMLLGTLGNK